MTRPPQVPDLTEREKQIVAALRDMAEHLGRNDQFADFPAHGRGGQVALNIAADAIERGEAWR